MIIGFRIWDEAGRGSYRDVEAAPTVVTHAAALSNGEIVYGVADGSWGIIDTTGKRTRFVEPSITNNALQQRDSRRIKARRYKSQFDL